MFIFLRIYLQLSVNYCIPSNCMITGSKQNGNNKPQPDQHCHPPEGFCPCALWGLPVATENYIGSIVKIISSVEGNITWIFPWLALPFNKHFAKSTLVSSKYMLLKYGTWLQNGRIYHHPNFVIQPPWSHYAVKWLCYWLQTISLQSHPLYAVVIQYNNATIIM